MYCKKCGKEIDPRSKFCNFCGEKVEEPEINFEKIKEEQQKKEEEQKKEEPKEPVKEAKKINFKMDDFNWDLDGFPKNETSKTDEIDFNWDSVVEKRKESFKFKEPISFKEEEEQKISHKNITSEKYELGELFKEDIKDEKSGAEENKENEEADIMELSFEDEIFNDISNEKPASATIRISQTSEFTDKLYAFDNKQAEYQSVLDAEYEDLKDNNEDLSAVIEEEEKDDIEKLDNLIKEDGPEIETGIATEDFLRELYGEQDKEEKADEDETSDEDEKKNETESADEPEKQDEEESANEEFSKEDDEKLSEDIEAVVEAVIEEEIKDSVDTEENGECPFREEDKEEETIISSDPEKQDEEEITETAEDETTVETDGEVCSEENETIEENEIAEDTENVEQIVNEEADEEIITEYNSENITEYVGVVLSRTPRGVLIIEKNNKEKLSRRTFFPSSGEENETSDGEEPSKDENEKLSFSDVFNDDDSNNDDYNNKAKKKGKVFKVIGIILFILIIIEACFIGIEYFAPESEAAKKIDAIYGSILSVVAKENSGENPEDLVTAYELSDYIVAEAGKFDNIASITYDADFKFPDDETFDLEGLSEAGKFEDRSWYTDDDGREVNYGQAIVEGVVQYYTSLVDYKNYKNEEVYNVLSETTELIDDIESIERNEDEPCAINSLEFGEVKTSETGIYVLTKVKYTDSEGSEQEAVNNIVFLKPEEQAMKIYDVVEF